MVTAYLSQARRVRARLKTAGKIALVLSLAFSLPALLLGHESAGFRDVSGWAALVSLATSLACFVAAAVITWRMRRERRKTYGTAASRDHARA